MSFITAPIFREINLPSQLKCFIPSQEPGARQSEPLASLWRPPSGQSPDGGCGPGPCRLFLDPGCERLLRRRSANLAHAIETILIRLSLFSQVQSCFFFFFFFSPCRKADEGLRLFEEQASRALKAFPLPSDYLCCFQSLARMCQLFNTLDTPQLHIWDCFSHTARLRESFFLFSANQTNPQPSWTWRRP